MSYFQDCCWECGMKAYHPQHQEALNGITVIKAVCHLCQHVTFIVPARDWELACKGITHPEEWD